MKKRSFAAVGLACMLSLAACNNEDSAADGSAVVVVDGTEITESDFVGTLKDRYGDDTLKELIQRHLIMDQRESVELTQEEIDEEINGFKTQFGVESDEELLELLKTQYNIDVESIDAFAEEYIIPPLVIQKLASEGVTITDEQKQTYFEENSEMFAEQVEASHILVKEKELANDILEKVKAGEDFAALAEEHSVDPGSAAKGGSLGFFGKGAMVPEFEKAAFALEVGDVSDVVETEHGFHIIKVTGKKATFEDFEADIEEQLTKEQSKPSDEVLNELIENADIEIKDKRYSNLLDEAEAPAVQ